jgi:hypothetical protein
VAKLNLVDLAGSENVGKSNVKGVNLAEAKKINTSLLTLRKCIEALSKTAASGTSPTTTTTATQQSNVGKPFQHAYVM